MNRFAAAVNALFLIFGVLCILYYLCQGIFVSFRQSILYLWLLLGGACILRFLLWRHAWALGQAAPFPGWLLWTLRIVIVLGLLFFAYVESFVLSAAFTKPLDGLDAVIVLGAKVDERGPSGSLRERIDAAAAYLRRNEGTVAVLSGGQGEDEPESEAGCMYRYLLAAGIDENRLILEEKSTSTQENMLFSFPLLQGRAERVGIVTNEFHMFRALALGNAVGGFELHGIPARSSVFGFVHYAVREFFTTVVLWHRGVIRVPLPWE